MRCLERAMANPLEHRFRQPWVEHLGRLREVERDVASRTTGEDLALRYSVPRIVCIGEESSGKSSTLERVAMMKVFPSDERLCTRVPIELRLRYRDPESLEERFREHGYVIMRMAPGVGSNMPEDVSSAMSPDEVPGQIRQWMEDLVRAANGEMTGVTDDKIIVELYSSLCVNLDLIDLPGIVAGSIPGEPADMMDRTRQLSASFVNDAANPHTFVIAVVSARDARIRNSQAMELVQRYNKVQFTIGALTMADRSADPRRENPYSKLVERLNGTADDAPALGLGYVALKNRDTVTDIDISLTQANTEEREWFQTRLPEHVESCGIESLIDKLVDKVEEYTRGPWIEAETARIEDERTAARNDLGGLGDFLPGNLDDLVRYFLGGIQEWQGPSILDLLEFVPTVYGGGNVFNIQSLSTDWQLETENWVHGDIEDLTPAYNASSRTFAPMKTFDINMFRGDTDLPLGNRRWTPCASVTQTDLFQIPTSNPSETPVSVKSDAVQKLNNILTNSVAGSLLFVGKRSSANENKMIGFFLAADTLRDHRNFIQAMLQQLSEDVHSPGFPFGPPPPPGFSFPRPSETAPNPFSRSQSPPSQPIPFGEPSVPPFNIGEPRRRPILRFRRPGNRPETTSSSPVVPNHDDVVVLMHDPKQKYQAGALGMTCELEQQYNTHRRIREKLLCNFSEKVDAVFTSVAESVVAKLTAFDARFDGFMDALTNVLLDWCDDRIQGAKAEFALYLDNSRMIVDRVALNDALKISAKHYFTNQLTARMREIILFEYADANILDAFTDGSLNTRLREYTITNGLSEETLIAESCAEERARLTSRLDALTTMRNALAIVFSSEARETHAMPEDAPSDDAAPITPSDVPEVSPTQTPSDLSQSLSRTFI